MILNGIDVMFSSPQRRCRSGNLWQLICGTLLLTLMGAGCSASQGYTGERAQDSGLTSSAFVAAAVEEPATEQVATVVPNVSEDTKTAKPEAVGPAPTTTPHPIAVADTELPKAPIGFESLFDRAATGPQPISIEIRAIGVNGAAIVPVGVNKDDLSFEVPPADQVGWYKFGSAPGEAGSAVLAAHIAFNGADGVFRRLANVEVGAIVAIGFSDGTTSQYRIEEVAQYAKEELPESLWARDGKEQLALITCGGAFNYQRDSYESNTVAIAVPIL